MIWAALVVAAAAVGASWVYNNVLLVAQRLHATRNMPDPMEGHWLLGHIPALLAKPLCSFRLFRAWAERYGPIYRVRFLGRPVVVVTDPDLYQPLLRSGPAKLHKYTPPYKMFEVFANPPRSNMLSSAETPVWKSARRAAVAALTMNNLRLCFPHITAVTQRLIDSLAAAGPEAVQDMDLAAQQITIDVIGLAAFDRDLQATLNRQTAARKADSSSSGSSPLRRVVPYKVLSSAGGGGSGMGITGRGAEVLETMRHLTVAMQSRNNPLNRWFPWRKAYRNLMYWGARMSELVLDLTADMEANPPPHHTLGRSILECRHCETGEKLDRVQIMTELGILWGAGFETTAHTICWALLLIATHPEVEARVLAELAALGLAASPDKPQPGTMKWEHLAQLKYLAAAINESMRLFPVVASGTIRVTHEPTMLGGHRLPAGQPIFIPFFAIHRSPKLWEDPDSYKPERWLKDESPAAGSAAVPAAKPPQPAAAAARSAGSVASDEEDYVDVGKSDVYLARDQDKGQQHQQGDVSRPGQPGSGVSSGPAKPSTTGLELKDPGVMRRGFLPFSEGSRNCVGQALALVELKAVLAMLLGNFSFRLAPEMGGYAGVDADARQAITLRPEHGLLMTARHRSMTA